ncbi:MAG: hypothetical protein JWQ22_2702, partial [Devosia sp.]|nr:hypothetical protein [Devosia sp.]
MLFEENTLLQLGPPARRARRHGIEALAGTQRRGQPPAQMRRAGFPRGAVAQQKNRASGTGSPQAQPPAGSEIEYFLMSGN